MSLLYTTATASTTSSNNVSCSNSSAATTTNTNNNSNDSLPPSNTAHLLVCDSSINTSNENTAASTTKAAAVCAVSSCLYHTQRPCRVPLVDFPDPRCDRDRCARWMRVCGVQRPVARCTRVCARHFESSDFVDDCDRKCGNVRLGSVNGRCEVVRVRDDVVPTRQLVVNPLSWSLETADEPASNSMSRASSASKTPTTVSSSSIVVTSAKGCVSTASTRVPSSGVRRVSKARRRQRYSNLVRNLMERGYGSSGSGGAASTATLAPRERAVLVEQALAEYERRQGQVPNSNIPAPLCDGNALHSVSECVGSSQRDSAVDVVSRQLSAVVDDAGIKEYGHGSVEEQCAGQYMVDSGTPMELADGTISSRLASVHSIHSSSTTLLSPVVSHSSSEHLNVPLSSSSSAESAVNNSNFYSVDSLSADTLLLACDESRPVDTTTPERVLNINLIVQPQKELNTELSSCFSYTARRSRQHAVSNTLQPSISSPCASDDVRASLDVTDGVVAAPCESGSDSAILPVLLEQAGVDNVVGVDTVSLPPHESSALPQSPPPPPYTKHQLSEWLSHSVSLLQVLQPALQSDCSWWRQQQQQLVQRGVRGTRCRLPCRRRVAGKAPLTSSPSAPGAELFQDSTVTDDTIGASASQSFNRMPCWLTDRSRELLRWRRHLHRLQRELDLEPNRTVLVKAAASEHGLASSGKKSAHLGSSKSICCEPTSERIIHPLLVLRDEDGAKLCENSVGSSFGNVSECLSTAVSSAELMTTPSSLVNALSLLHRQRLLNQQLYSALLRTSRQLKRLYTVTSNANETDSVLSDTVNATTGVSTHEVGVGRRWSEIEIVRALELRRQCSPNVYSYVRTMYGDGRLPDLGTLSSLAKKYSSARGKISTSSSGDCGGDILSGGRLDVAGLPVAAGITGAGAVAGQSVTDRFDRMPLISSDSSTGRSILSVTGGGADPPLWECLGEYVDGCGGILTQVSSSNVPIVMVGEDGVGANADSCSGAVSKRRHSSCDVLSVDGCDVVWSDATMLDGSGALLDSATSTDKRQWPPSKFRASSALLEAPRALYVPSSDGGLSGSVRPPASRRRRLDVVVPRETSEQLALVSSVGGQTAELENSVQGTSPLGSPQWLNAVTFSDVPNDSTSDV